MQLDKDIDICFGLNILTPDFEANTDWGLFRIRYNSDGSVNLTPLSTGHSRFVFHGIVLYLTWFVLGFFLLATKRYFKFNWLVMHLAHLLVGMVVFVVTIAMGYQVL